LERLIGRTVPVRASLSAGLRPSTITVSVSGRAIASGVMIGRLADGTRDTVFEQPTTASEAVTAGAIGEKTVVSDAMEAVRQSVQQKAADELVGIECHHFGLAVRSIVFPGKADLPIGEREQPAVGDGDAMGVAAEIGQHLFGASERWLGVDHPVEALEFAQATCEGLRFGKIGEIGEEP
jgi:hypothetical protein